MSKLIAAQDKLGAPTLDIVLPDFRGGGVERLTIELAGQFAVRGVRPTFLVTSGRGELLDEASRIGAVVDLRATRLRNALPALSRRWRKHQPDAVLAEMYPLTVLAPIAAKIAGLDVPIVVSEHNSLVYQHARKSMSARLRVQAATAIGYRLADRVVGVSRGVVDDCVALSGIGRDHTAVINNPTRRFADPGPDDLRQAEGHWGEARTRLLTVGSLRKQKNQALLLRALARLKHLDPRLVILGSGPEEGSLREVAAKLNITDRVEFAGFRDDPFPFYRAADLFVLSSDFEGFGNVLAEAMASGCPVVSTRSSGPAEILADGKFGVLTPPGDEAALAEGIEATLTNPVSNAVLEARGRDFDVAAIADRYLAILGLQTSP